MIDETTVLTMRELKKFFRSPFLLLMTFIQPVMWLGLFGKAFNLSGLFSIPREVLDQLPPSVTSSFSQITNQALRSIFGGTTDYFSYMAAGMLSVIILFTSMFSGMSIVWDRRLGFLNKLLAAPISRMSIVLSKVLSSIVRGLIQATLVFLVALALGFHAASAIGLADVLVAFSALFLLSFSLSSLFIAITLRVKDWQTQMAMMNLLNLPLMFASSALFPIRQMPSWLQTVANLNPISYASDAVRQSLLNGMNLVNSSSLLLDFQFLIAFSVAFILSSMLLAGRSLTKS